MFKLESCDIYANDLYIVDFDGTLVDTESLYWSSVLEYIKGSVPSSVSLGYLMSEYKGKSINETVSLLKENFNLKLDSGIFDKEVSEIFNAKVSSEGLRFNKKILSLLGSYGSDFCILTANSKEYVEGILESHNLLNKFNGGVISVKTGKSTKSDYFGVLKAFYKGRVTVIEDSDVYCKQADDLGLSVMRVNHCDFL